MNINNAYGNIEIYSPSNELMFRTNQGRLNFYIKKELVEKIGEDQYRFLFEPKGKGHGDRNKELLEPRKNECVCCGNKDILILTRHHIVPTRFRKFLPDNIKGYNHRYVVMLCVDCHEDYGYFENELNDELAKKYNIPTIKECVDSIYTEKRIIVGMADTILYKDRIPQERIEEIKVQFKERTGLEPTEDNLHKVRKRKYEPVSNENDFGKLVIDNIQNIYEFQQMWLEHFVEMMEPKFLPNDLKILLDSQE